MVEYVNINSQVDINNYGKKYTRIFIAYLLVNNRLPMEYILIRKLRSNIQQHVEKLYILFACLDMILIRLLCL